ncbi:hypothetical protein EV401DRAFT_2008491 [Pisolithus croceorrhizus]|nr:hypothetical protein EV401DRAFT_2008491 [Pisolithus croceorrhizus]
MVQWAVITSSTTALASGAIPSLVSQIVSAMLKFVTENSPPVSGSVFFFVAVVILVSIFSLALRIALYLHWLGRAFVRFLGFGSKGVTKGSISNTWLLHAGSPIFLRFPCCDLPILALGSDHSCRFHILIIPVYGCRAALDVDISQTSMNCACRCSRGGM